MAAAADRLPAHDLLDRIFHQGEVLARYRLAVPRPSPASKPICAPCCCWRSISTAGAIRACRASSTNCAIA
jgi:hypothetical protein